MKNNNNNKNKKVSLWSETHLQQRLLVTKLKRRLCFANAGIVLKIVCETFLTGKKNILNQVSCIEFWLHVRNICVQS